MSKRIPKVGEVLIHRFRKRDGEAKATVLSVNQETQSVTVRVNGKVYNSLSGSASAVAGVASNGWIFWGLKPAKSYHRQRER